jgi:transcriptional regulator with XRE-family HTH domain
MAGPRVGRSLRFLRLRAGWRQEDVARRAGTSRELVSRLERGQADGVTLGALRRVAEALGSWLAVDVRLQGEQLDRLMDGDHAALEEHATADLRTKHWRVEAEVSFNRYGDRGRIDLLGFHEATGTLIVVEAKTRVNDIQDLLGRLDLKVQLGAEAALLQGWPRPRRVIPCLLLADQRSNRRIVAAHPALFAKFNLRGRAAWAWLNDPRGPDSDDVTGLLVFEKLPNSRPVTGSRAPRRVSRRNSRQA